MGMLENSWKERIETGSDNHTHTKDELVNTLTYRRMRRHEKKIETTEEAMPLSNIWITF